MLKFVDVSFPLSDQTPGRISDFNWDQRRYEHDMGKIRFVDWNPDPVVLTSGSPVRITIRRGDLSKTHYAYVHHVVHNKSSDTSYVDVYVIGSSYPMKQQNQEVYANITASSVVKEIADKYNFSYDIAPHPRVFPQISSPGYSDWQLMSDLAKKVGYSLRSESGALFFKPLTEDYERLLPEASEFIAVTPGNPIPPSLYSITPMVGDAINYADASKAAVAVSGYDPKLGARFNAINESPASTLRTRVNPEIFDRYDVNTTTTTISAANYEVQAAQELNRFPYRAHAVLVGTPALRPDMPIKISGVNRDLDGYWVVIAANHIVENAMYTTEVEIGLDSLGAGQITTPKADLGKVVIPAPVLYTSRSPVLPAKTFMFSKVSNRLSGDSSSMVSAVWRGAGVNLRSSTSSASKVSQVVSA